MNNVKSNLKGVIGSKPSGILITNLESEYFDVTHSRLNYQSFGYPTIRSLLEDISDIVKISVKDGKPIVTMVTSNNDPMSLKNLTDLMNRTSVEKERQRNRHGKIQKAPEKIIRSLDPLKKSSNTNLKRKDGNEMLFDRIREGNTDHLLNNVSNMSQDQNIPVLTDTDISLKYSEISSETFDLSYSTMHSIKNGTRTPLRQHSVNAPVNSVARLILDGSTAYIRQQPMYPNENGVIPSIMNGSVSRLSLCRTQNQSEGKSNWGCWFLKPVINFDALYKEVIVLGVQSGQALVVGVNRQITNDVVKTKNVITFYPGDMNLWQPPFDDPQRPEGYVDFHTVFPVIVIKRLNAKKIQIRVLGLTSLLEVNTRDIFQLPLSPDDLSKLVKIIKTRETTMLILAAIPTNIDVWHNAVLSGVFTVLYSIDDGGSILERSNNKGNFLNLALLDYIQEHVAINFNTEEQRLFMNHFMYLLDRSLSAISPTYEKFMSGKDIYPDGHPLSWVYNIDECQGKMLIGCMHPVAKDIIKSKADLLVKDSCTLLRLKYSGNMLSFYTVDKQSVDITISEESPFIGIYIINDAFICSTTTKNDHLRFKTAFLLAMPSVTDVLSSLDRAV